MVAVLGPTTSEQNIHTSTVSELTVPMPLSQVTSKSDVVYQSTKHNKHNDHL